MCCVLCVACCVLLLCAACCVLRAVCVLCVAYCVLRAVCCVLCAACCVLRSVCCLLCTAVCCVLLCAACCVLLCTAVCCVLCCVLCCVHISESRIAYRLASAGMDNSIRVWNVEDDKLQQTISAGHAAKEGCYFKPRVIQTPEVRFPVTGARSISPVMLPFIPQ